MTLPDDIELAKELDDYLQNSEWGVTIFAGHRDVLVNELVKFVATERTKARIDELERLREFWGESNDPTLGGEFKFVSLYDLDKRLTSLKHS